MSDLVTWRTEGRVGLMTIQRPEVLNALNPAANAQMATLDGGPRWRTRTCG